MVVFFITIARLGMAKSSILATLTKGLSIVELIILDNSSKRPKPDKPAMITRITRLNVMWEVFLKLLDINRAPINHPNNHNNKNDLCIIPPATAIIKKRIMARVFMDEDLISSSFNRLADVKKVVHAKTANGPNGWVNSW